MGIGLTGENGNLVDITSSLIAFTLCDDIRERLKRGEEKGLTADNILRSIDDDTSRHLRTVVLLGDGELDEGSVWEAALAASKHRLERLTVIVDHNRMQSYGPTAEVLGLEPLAAKWRAFGFAVREVAGHDVVALRRVLRRSLPRAGVPTAVIAHTVKGRGIPAIEHDPAWHHKNRVSDAELEELDRGLCGGGNQ